MGKENIKKTKSRVVVAMSGGVDSSVAAYLLKKQGYDVVGIFLKFWQPSADSCGKERENACCNLQSLMMARQIAERLDIPFYVIHAEEYFKKEIVDNFISEYEKGLTPNPCVRCNRYIKFGLLWKKARSLGADCLATGHYIKTGQFQYKDEKRIKNQASSIKKNLNYNPTIIRPKDFAKDQTYFLSSINPAIIPYLLFPLGSLEKKEVRAIAKKVKLPVYSKKDSVGICFIPDGDNESFLTHYTDKLNKSGDIMDKKGNILGQHKGLLGYTIGEKVGDSEVAARYAKKTNDRSRITNKSQNPNDKKLGIGNWKVKSDVPRLYVIAIDIVKNQLIVGENKDCFSDTLEAKDLNIINEEMPSLAKKKKLYAQIRGGHKAEKGRLSIKKDKVFFKFDKPVRAITPGQTVAFYDKNILLGGAVITK